MTKLRGAGQPQELPGRGDKFRDKASSLRKGGRDQVSGETSLKNSLGEGTAFETRPHPCKQGDVTKSQGSRASSRTLRGRGTEPETPWSQLLGVSSSGEQVSLHSSQRGVDSESRVYPRHNLFGRELPGEGGPEPETPWAPQLGVQLVRGAGQPPQLSGGRGQSQRLPGRSCYDTRPHPCKQGDVTESQGSREASRVPRVRGVTPMKPITIKTRIFVSSSRKRKQECSRKESSEEEKMPKIRQSAKFFPRRGWSVTEKELLVTSGEY